MNKKTANTLLGLTGFLAVLQMKQSGNRNLIPVDGLQVNEITEKYALLFSKFRQGLLFGNPYMIQDIYSDDITQDRSVPIYVIPDLKSLALFYRKKKIVNPMGVAKMIVEMYNLMTVYLSQGGWTTILQQFADQQDESEELVGFPSFSLDEQSVKTALQQFTEDISNDLPNDTMERAKMLFFDVAIKRDNNGYYVGKEHHKHGIKQPFIVIKSDVPFGQISPEEFRHLRIEFSSILEHEIRHFVEFTIQDKYGFIPQKLTQVDSKIKNINKQIENIQRSFFKKMKVSKEDQTLLDIFNSVAFLPLGHVLRDDLEKVITQKNQLVLPNTPISASQSRSWSAFDTISYLLQLDKGYEYEYIHWDIKDKLNKQLGLATTDNIAIRDKNGKLLSPAPIHNAIKLGLEILKLRIQMDKLVVQRFNLGINPQMDKDRSWIFKRAEQNTILGDIKNNVVDAFVENGKLTEDGVQFLTIVKCWDERATEQFVALEIYFREILHQYSDRFRQIQRSINSLARVERLNLSSIAGLKQRSYLENLQNKAIELLLKIYQELFKEFNLKDVRCPKPRD